MHRQFWDWLTGLLHECQHTLGSYRASIDFFAGLLRSSFSQMCMALIPPCLDQILVGSIERSRHPELKVVFLLGTTQRQFPAPLPQGGLLSDRDRDQAALAGLCLDAGLTQTLSQRRYLAYIAFTRPAERLIVSYPLADEKGNAVVRSQFIDDLEQLFDDLSVGRLDAEADNQGSMGEGILCQYELSDFVCCHDQAERVLTKLAIPELSNRFQNAVRARAQQREAHTLAPDVLRDQFGSVLTTSASQLSSFAACPYQYFARYTLALKPRRELVLEPLDLGNFYHRALEHFVQTVMRSQQDWAALETAGLLAVLDQVIERLMQSDPRLMAFMRHSATNAFVINGACDVLRAAVPDLALMTRAGQFRPAYTEAAFGMGTRELGDFELDLAGQGKVTLQGVVDRVDLSSPGADARALVFDYKRRERKPDWTGLYFGLDLQLGIYMLALRNAHEQGLIDAPAAGAFFLPVEVPSVKVGLSEPQAKLLRFKRKARGLFDADIADRLDALEQGESQFYNFFKKKDGSALGKYKTRGSLEHARFELLLRFVRDKIKELSQSIMVGQVAVRPCRQGAYTPCTYCPYRPLCRFDGQIHAIRYLQGHDKTEVLEKLEGIYGP